MKSFAAISLQDLCRTQGCKIWFIFHFRRSSISCSTMLLNPWRFRRVGCRKFPSSAASVKYNNSRYLIQTKNTLKLRTNTNFQSANGENCGCLDQIILDLFPSSWVQRGSLFNTFQLCPLALTCTIYQGWHDELFRIGISLRHRQSIKKIWKINLDTWWFASVQMLHTLTWPQKPDPQANASNIEKKYF